MEVLFTPEGLLSLLMLATLEIVLGVDNLVFISIAVSRLPAEQRSKARKFGLALACITRLALLMSLAWLARMKAPLFSIADIDLSVRDLVLIGGGLFLLIKGTMEIHEAVEGGHDEGPAGRAFSSFGYVIAQIAVIDIVFSLDSVITAVGLVNEIPIMTAAIIAAVLVMMLASDPVGNFIDRHPTIKMLALAFIILIGVALIADGLSFHIPRGYLYFGMAFSAGVEALNLVAHSRRRKKEALRSARHEGASE